MPSPPLAAARGSRPSRAPPLVPRRSPGSSAARAFGRADGLLPHPRSHGLPALACRCLTGHTVCGCFPLRLLRLPADSALSCNWHEYAMDPLCIWPPSLYRLPQRSWGRPRAPPPQSVAHVCPYSTEVRALAAGLLGDHRAADRAVPFPSSPDATGQPRFLGHRDLARRRPPLLGFVAPAHAGESIHARWGPIAPTPNGSRTPHLRRGPTMRSPIARHRGLPPDPRELARPCLPRLLRPSGRLPRYFPDLGWRGSPGYPGTRHLHRPH